MLQQRRTVDEELEAARERQAALREQIERLRTLLDASQKSIGLDETHFRAAISCALTLVGAEPLAPAQGNGALSGPTLLVKSLLNRAPSGVTRDGAPAGQSGPASAGARPRAHPGARRSPGPHSSPWP